jgi:hypothetical protein
MLKYNARFEALNASQQQQQQQQQGGTSAAAGAGAGDVRAGAGDYFDRGIDPAPPLPPGLAPQPPPPEQPPLPPAEEAPPPPPAVGARSLALYLCQHICTFRAFRTPL